MTNEIVIKANQSLGVWHGLGGAITESTAYNFAKLDTKKQQKLLAAYYGKNGLDYRWGRVSIGSNDFCLAPFEYTTRPDLKDFSIRHDEKYVLPMLQQILTNKNLKLIASPWSPPRFMKLQIHRQKFYSILKPWYYQKYASYILKWLKAYKKAGVSIDYITPQNEPRANQIWESCFYTFRAQKKLAYEYLAKVLKNTETQILLWDHNKSQLTKVADKLLNDSVGRDQKTAGLCYHWYDGARIDEMWRVRKKYPDIIMISSEMSCGFSPYDEKTWQNDANQYLYELFHDINTGASAFIDWNMLLDFHGGPSYCKNYVKSPIILNAAGDDFILTPIYYALRNFAKLFPAGSKVVRLEYNSRDFVAVAHKTQSGYQVVIANLSNKTQKITIKLNDQTSKSITIQPTKIKAFTLK